MAIRAYSGGKAVDDDDVTEVVDLNGGVVDDEVVQLDDESTEQTNVTHTLASEGRRNGQQGSTAGQYRRTGHHLGSTTGHYCERLIKTVFLNLSILSVGMCTALLGPLLPDLELQTSSGLLQAAWIFVGRGIGYILGGVTGSYLGTISSHSSRIALAMFLLSVGVAIMPLVTNLAVLSFAVGLQGVAIGLVKSGVEGAWKTPYITGGGGGISGGGGGSASCSSTKYMYITLALGALLASLLSVPFTATSQHTATLPSDLTNISSLFLPSGNHKPGTGQVVDISQWLYRGHPREFVGYKRRKRDSDQDKNESGSAISHDLPNNVTTSSYARMLTTNAATGVSIATVVGSSPPSTIAAVISELVTLAPNSAQGSSGTNESQIILTSRSNSSDVNNYSETEEVNSYSTLGEEYSTDTESTTTASTVATTLKAKKPAFANGGSLNSKGADGSIIRAPIRVEVKKTVPPLEVPEIIAPLTVGPTPPFAENMIGNKSTPQVESFVTSVVDLNISTMNANTSVPVTSDSLGIYDVNVTMMLLNRTNTNKSFVIPSTSSDTNITTVFTEKTNIDIFMSSTHSPDTFSVPQLILGSGSPTVSPPIITAESTPPFASPPKPLIVTLTNSTPSVTSMNNSPTVSVGVLTVLDQGLAAPAKDNKLTTLVHGPILTPSVSNPELTSRMDKGLTRPDQVPKLTPSFEDNKRTSSTNNPVLTPTVLVTDARTVNSIGADQKTYKNDILLEATAMRYLVWIIALISVLSATGLVFAWFYYDRALVMGDTSSNLPLLPTTPSYRDNTFDSNDSLATLDTSSISRAQSIPEMGSKICTQFFYTLCIGIESTFVNLAPSFVTARFLWSLTDGAMVCGGFWGAYTFGRIISSACFSLSRRAVVQTLSSLVAALFLITCEVMLLLSWGGSVALTHESSVVVWYAAGLVGFALALTPSLTSENNLDESGSSATIQSEEFSDSAESASFEKSRQSNTPRKSHRCSTTLMLLSPGIAEIIFPTITAVLMSTLGPDWFIHTLAVMTTLSLIGRIFVHCVTARRRRNGARYAPLLLNSGAPLGGKSSIETLSIDEGEDYDTREDATLLTARPPHQEVECDVNRGRTAEGGGGGKVVGASSNGVGGGRVVDVGRRVSPSHSSPTLVQTVMRTITSAKKD